MKLLAKLPDRIILIAFLILLINIGQHDLHRHILVDILFKSHQLRDEMIQLGLCLRRCHEEENVIQVAFFRNDAVSSEILRQNDTGDAEVFILACLHRDARRHELQLQRVDEVLPLAIALEGVPFPARLKGKVGNIRRHILRVALFPLLVMDDGRYDRAQVLAATKYGLSGLDGLHDTLMPKEPARFAFLHLGIHIQRCEDLVIRRCRGIYHEGIVHDLVRHIALLPFDVAILFEDLGRLREASLLLMHRLRHDDARILRPKVQEERTRVFHHRDELLIAHPGRVKDDVVTQMADLIHHLPRIIDAAVIIAELEHRCADRTIHERALRIPLCDQHADVFFIEAVIQHPADEAEGISRRFQINRNRACLNERAIAHGLVIVSLV